MPFSTRPVSRIVRRWILLGCLCLWAGAASGQVALRGTVLDAMDGEPLPHATVQVAGSSRGTVSNAQGQFLITLSGLPATLEVRYIGYHSARVEVTDRDLSGLEIRMEPATMQMDEVVITGENPAEAMVRKAIQARDRMMRHISGTYADVYTRFLLFSDFDLVQMNESVRADWWSPSGGRREIVRAERIQPVRSGQFRFAQPLPVPNFLDADVQVLGARYAGPLHPDAINLYQFTLGPTREYDGRRVMEIFFFPKNPTLPAFSGSMSLLDSTWAVLQVNARPWPGTDIVPPVQSHDIQLEQRFVAIGDTMWVPQSLVVQGLVTFGRAGVGYPPARYQQVSGLSLHVVNPPVPDSLARPGPAEVRDPMLPYNNDLFRRNPSYIPATPLEAEQIATMDPTMTLHRAFRGEGLLATYASIDFTRNTEPGEEPGNPRLALAQRITGGDWFWFNRVDGWHPGAGYGGALWDGGLWRVAGGWSIERRRPTYKAEVSIPWKLGPLKGFAGMQALDATSVVARSEGLGRFVPGVAAYLGWDDLYDYYDLRKQQVNLDLALGPLPALVSVRLNNERHRSLDKKSHFNGWLFRNVQRENPMTVEGQLRSTEVAFQLGDRKKASLDLSWEQSPGWRLSSDFRFTRLEGRVTVRTNTFYRRRNRPNWIRITLLGGTSDGSLPVQRQFGLSGSAGPFSEFTGFRTLPNGRFLADELLGVFWAHDFTTAPFEKLGLWGLAEKGWGLHVFGGHAFSSDPDLGTFNGLHHELGVGLSYPFGLPLRLDVAHGSAGGWYLKFGRPLR